MKRNIFAFTFYLFFLLLVTPLIDGVENYWSSVFTIRNLLSAVITVLLMALIVFVFIRLGLPSPSKDQQGKNKSQ
jgi:large-conductance mechanosensitive channel